MRGTSKWLCGKIFETFRQSPDKGGLFSDLCKQFGITPFIQESVSINSLKTRADLILPKGAISHGMKTSIPNDSIVGMLTNRLPRGAGMLFETLFMEHLMQSLNHDASSLSGRLYNGTIFTHGSDENAIKSIIGSNALKMGQAQYGKGAFFHSINFLHDSKVKKRLETILTLQDAKDENANSWVMCRLLKDPDIILLDNIHEVVAKSKSENDSVKIEVVGSCVGGDLTIRNEVVDVLKNNLIFQHTLLKSTACAFGELINVAENNSVFNTDEAKKSVGSSVNELVISLSRLQMISSIRFKAIIEELITQEKILERAKKGEVISNNPSLRNY